MPLGKKTSPLRPQDVDLFPHDDLLLMHLHRAAGAVPRVPGLQRHPLRLQGGAEDKDPLLPLMINLI